MKTRIFLVLTIVSLFIVSSITAAVYPYSAGKTVVGSLSRYTTKHNESLIEIARKFGLGYNEITEANPKLDPFVPGDGVSVCIPTAWILPDMPSYDGIVINLSEMRLYYFTGGKQSSVMTFPIGVGSDGKETPEGIFRIVQKIVNPSWYVPESIAKEKPDLPKVVPPGPDNPLGTHALRLSERTVLIHGTNRPYAVGRKASHGCIRLYPEDIPKLFSAVPANAKVSILRQPVKVGKINDRIYLETHRDPEMKINYFNEAVRLLVKKGLLQQVDKEKMLSTLREKKGIPVDISN